MAEDLTPDELTCLRWCRALNENGVGYLGPSVKRGGPIPAYLRLVREGLVTCVERGEPEACGYRITLAGWDVLAEAERPPERRKG